MAEAVESLLCKCEALISNPSPPTKKKILEFGLEEWLK
jgi:hypothetical protein